MNMLEVSQVLVLLLTTQVKKRLDANPHHAVSPSGRMLSASDKLENLTAILPTPQFRMLSMGLPLCPGNFPLQVEEALKPTQYAHSKQPPRVFPHMLFIWCAFHTPAATREEALCSQWDAVSPITTQIRIMYILYTHPYC